MKNMNHSWGTIQRLASDRDRSEGASLLPYTPAGVTGGDDDDDRERHDQVRIAST